MGATLHGGQIGWNAQQQFESDDFVAQTGKRCKTLLPYWCGWRRTRLVRMTRYITDRNEYTARLKEVGRDHRCWAKLPGDDLRAGRGTGGSARTGRNRGHGHCLHSWPEVSAALRRCAPSRLVWADFIGL
jgi:hypothetical protein